MIAGQLLWVEPSTINSSSINSSGINSSGPSTVNSSAINSSEFRRGRLAAGRVGLNLCRMLPLGLLETLHEQPTLLLEGRSVVQKKAQFLAKVLHLKTGC